MKPEGEDDKKKGIAEQLSDMRKSFFAFLYSKNEDGDAVIMGRTGPSWGKISLFFFVYYSCLAGFFAVMFVIAFSTMPEREDGPKYTAFIADRPVLHVFPENVDSYKRGDPRLNDTVIKDYDNFLKDYAFQRKPCYGADVCASSGNFTYRAETSKKQCRFDMSSLGECAYKEGHHYGYNDAPDNSTVNGPCIYFRLSKIYGWKPEPETGNGNFVRLKCEPNYLKIKYFPEGGFPISYWPFRGENHFMLPLAAIKVETDKLVTIRCHAIAKNIERTETYKVIKGATGQVELDVYPPRKK